MTGLSREAREVLKEGLAFDGPDSERRARVKQQLLVTLGGGAAVLGGAGTATGAAGAATSGIVAAGAKGLVASSLWVWFGLGTAAGVGVGGAAALLTRAVDSGHAVPSAVAVAGPMSAPAAPAAPLVVAAAATDVEAAPARDPAVPGPARVEPRLAPASTAAADVAGNVTALPVAGSPASPASTLREEAALLQRAQQALAAQAPSAALTLLAEHEQRFPAGALGEERRAAKVLALCALGRTEEARVAARAFAKASPGSVLVPRLRKSCVGPELR